MKNKSNKSQSNESQILVLLQSLASRMDAIESNVVATVTTTDVPKTAKANKGKANKGQSDKAKKYASKMEAIKAARELAATRSLPDAIKLATAQIIHNEKRGFVNEKITNQKSLRRFLESPEHQALKTVRDNTATSPADIEAMLNAAYEKAIKKAAKV